MFENRIANTNQTYDLAPSRITTSNTAHTLTVDFSTFEGVISNDATADNDGGTLTIVAQAPRTRSR